MSSATSPPRHDPGFPKKVREVMERFAFDQEIARMAEKNILYEVVKKFAKDVTA
jgi:hypothetical protein